MALDQAECQESANCPGDTMVQAGGDEMATVVDSEPLRVGASAGREGIVSARRPVATRRPTEFKVNPDQSAPVDAVRLRQLRRLVSHSARDVAERTSPNGENPSDVIRAVDLQAANAAARDADGSRSLVHELAAAWADGFQYGCRQQAPRAAPADGIANVYEDER